MSSISLDDHTSGLLTHEELAAINDGAEDDQPSVGDDDEGEGDDADLPQSSEGVADGEDSDDGDKAAEQPENVEVEQAAAPIPGNATEQRDTVTVATTAEDPPAEAFRPQYVAQTPEGYDQQLAVLKQSTNALNVKLYTGEVDAETYGAQLDALTDQRDALLTAKIKAELANEMGVQSSQQEFSFVVNKFVRGVAASDGVDYRTDAAKQADLDGFMRALANNPANAEKSMEWFLSEAHRRVKSLHGIDTPSVVTDPVAQKTAVKPQRKPSTDKIAPSLALVPGGEGPGDVAGEFSNLDGLDGLDLEDAIARMTPAQRNRYVQAA